MVPEIETKKGGVDEKGFRLNYSERSLKNFDIYVELIMYLRTKSNVKVKLFDRRLLKLANR